MDNIEEFDFNKILGLNDNEIRNRSLYLYIVERISEEQLILMNWLLMQVLSLMLQSRVNIHFIAPIKDRWKLLKILKERL